MKDNRYRIFNKKWFNDNQNWLLYLLNHKMFKYYFREIFNMTDDCTFNERIINIIPNGFKVYEGETKNGSKIRAMFFTGDVYSRIVYFKFKEIWKFIHNWDTKIANNLAPSLNLGYDSLSVYPDDDPETDSVDGYCGVTPAFPLSFASIITANGDESNDDSTSSYLRLHAYSTTDTYDTNYRQIALFDTSSLGSSATISEVKMKVYGVGGTLQGLTGKEDTPDVVHCIDSNGIDSNTAVISSDYEDAFGSTSYGTWTISAFGATGYSEITLNSSGEANVSKTGVSKYGYIFGWDLNGSFGGTWVSGAEQYAAIYTAEYTTNTYYEVLTITYTSSTTVNIHQMMM